MKTILLQLFLLMFSVKTAFSQHAVRVISSTKSGHTMRLNIGSLEGVKKRSLGKIYANIGSQKFPKLLNIGDGEVVKLGASESYWFIRKPMSNAQFEKNSVVLLYLKDRVYNGLGNIKATRKKIVIPVRVGKKTVKKNMLRGMPEDLVMAEDNFEIGRKLLDKKPISDSDIIVTDMQTWKVSSKKIFHEKHGHEYTVKRLRNLEAKRKLDDIESAEETYIYEKMVNGSTAKVNKLYYGIDELYQDQKRDEDNDEFIREISAVSVYDTHKSKFKKQAILSDATAEYIDIEGPLWSASMGDDQLRRFIHNSGISRENIRKQSSVTARLGHEFIFGLTSFMTNSTVEEDPNNRSTSYNLDIGYELHLERLGKSFHNFGLEVFFHRGVSYYPLSETINGRFQLGAFSAALNFYIYNRPTTLNKMIWFVGVGAYRGQATVDSFELTKTYRYQVFSSPILQTGLKYRFANINDFYGETPIGVGISAKYSMGVTTVTATSTIDESDELEGAESFVESKLSMAVNVYF